MSEGSPHVTCSQQLGLAISSARSLCLSRLSIEVESESSSQGAESTSPLKEATEADEQGPASTSGAPAVHANLHASQAPRQVPRPPIAASPFAHHVRRNSAAAGASPGGASDTLSRHSLLEQVWMPPLLSPRSLQMPCWCRPGHAQRESSVGSFALWEFVASDGHFFSTQIHWQYPRWISLQGC